MDEALLLRSLGFVSEVACDGGCGHRGPHGSMSLFTAPSGLRGFYCERCVQAKAVAPFRRWLLEAAKREEAARELSRAALWSVDPEEREGGFRALRDLVGRRGLPG